jgi:S1-C subfamily serine protease
VVHYVAPGSPAEKKEIERGDAILEIDGVAVSSVRDYRKMVEKIKGAVKPGLFLILKKDDGNTRFVALRPGH